MKKINEKTVKKYLFIGSILFYPALLFLVLYVYVNIGSFILAFQQITDLSGTRKFVGFENFIAFFDGLKGNSFFLHCAGNSLKMYAINLVVCIPLYILFSFYIFKKHFASRVIRIIVMVPAIVSVFIVSMVFSKFVEGSLPSLLKKLGFGQIGSLLKEPKYSFGTTVFYMIWVSFSTALVIFPNAMNSINNEVIESAMIDGVNELQELWYIVLPLIYPTLSTFLITGVAGIFINQGPLIAFYMYDAPYEVYNIGYYMYVEVLRDQATAIYRYAEVATSGIMVTLVSVPVTLVVKFLLEHYGPTTEY